MKDWQVGAADGVRQGRRRRRLRLLHRQYIVQIIDARLIIQNTLQDSVAPAAHVSARNHGVVQKYIFQKLPIYIIWNM